jgi:SAM-dependent methyltransferase
LTANFSLLRQPVTGNELSEKDDALIAPDGAIYPIVKGIPRFVAADGYAEDFGWQWKRFRQTQLDSYSGITLSHDRLQKCLHGHLAQLAGKSVLEAGSGAGRFTEPLLAAGADLCSFDLSVAVEANQENNGTGFTLVQADIRYIPFAAASFDYVICLGVVQHTPDPEETIRSLYSRVRPGGYLCIDHYIRNWRWVVPPPFGYAVGLYRKLVLALPRKKRFAAVEKIVKFWFPLHWQFRDSRIMRMLLPRLSPVAFYYPGIPLRTREDYYEWALLDTHDSLTDHYKHLRSPADIEATLHALGAIEIKLVEGGNGVEAFCRKPS